MTPERKAYFRAAMNDPVFSKWVEEIAQRRNVPVRWKPGRTEAELAYETGKVDGIDFVLQTIGYVNDR